MCAGFNPIHGTFVSNLFKTLEEKHLVSLFKIFQLDSIHIS